MMDTNINIEVVETSTSENFKAAGAITSKKQAATSVKEFMNDTKIKVKSIVFHVSNNKAVPVIDHSSDGHEAREAIKCGYIGNFSYFSNGNTMQFENVQLNRVSVQFDNLQQAEDYINSPEGFFLIPGGDAYRFGARMIETADGYSSEEVLFNLKGEVVELTEEEVNELWVLKPCNYSPNAVKTGAGIFFNGKLCTEEDDEDFTARLTRGGNEYNNILYSEAGGVTASKFSEDRLRFTAGKASSTGVSAIAENKAIRYIAAKEGVDTKDFLNDLVYYTYYDQEVQELLGFLSEGAQKALFEFHKSVHFNAAIILKNHFADGQIIFEVEKGAYTLRVASGKMFTAKSIMSVPFQTRPMGTMVKAAGFFGDDPVINAELELYKEFNEGVVEHFINIEETIDDSEKMMAISHAIAGNYHMINKEKYPYKEGDILYIGYPNSNGVIVPECIITQDEAKHGVMQTDHFKNPFQVDLNIMTFTDGPKQDVYEVNISNQISTSLVAADPQAGLDYLVEAGDKMIKGQIGTLLRQKPKKFLDASMLNESTRSYASTDVQQSMPSAVMKHQVLAKTALEGAIKSSQKEINKDRVKAVGANLVIIPDMFIRLGFNILEEDEIFLPSFDKVAKYGTKVKTEGIQDLMKIKNVVSDSQKEVIESIIEKLYDEIKFYDRKVIFVARHPKMGKNQFMNYKVVGIKHIEEKSLQLVKQKRGYKMRHHHIMMRLVKAIGDGTIMMPAYAFNQELHSGNDYDIDGVVAILDKSVTELSSLLLAMAAKISFK